MVSKLTTPAKTVPAPGAMGWVATLPVVLSDIEKKFLEGVRLSGSYMVSSASAHDVPEALETRGFLSCERDNGTVTRSRRSDRTEIYRITGLAELWLNECPPVNPTEEIAV